MNSPSWPLLVLALMPAPIGLLVNSLLLARANLEKQELIPIIMFLSILAGGLLAVAFLNTRLTFATICLMPFLYAGVTAFTISCITWLLM